MVQRINYWICNIEVTGDLDNDSFGRVLEKEDLVEQEKERIGQEEVKIVNIEI